MALLGSIGGAECLPSWWKPKEGAWVRSEEELERDIRPHTLGVAGSAVRD